MEAENGNGRVCSSGGGNTVTAPAEREICLQSCLWGLQEWDTIIKYFGSISVLALEPCVDPLYCLMAKMNRSLGVNRVSWKRFCVSGKITQSFPR